MGDQEEEADQNQFHCLPDDVVLHIFNKLPDVTWLCRCVVVSKQFSSLIPRVQTVSLQSTNSNFVFNPCSVSPIEKWYRKRKFLEFFLKPHGYLRNLPLSPPSRRLFPDFAFHLKQIQSLNIELPFDFIGNNDSVLKWGAKFTTELNSFTVLHAASPSRMMESEEEEDNDGVDENGITRREIDCRVNLAVEYVRDAMWWVGILFHLIPKYPMLQSISITDAKNKGVKLCLRGEKLVGCRSTFNISSMIYSKTAGGSVPFLRLPNSRYAMKGVTTADMKGRPGKTAEFKASGGDGSETERVELETFAGEGGVFSEVMVQIQAKRKEVINLS
ncbi:F-box protein At4g18380-like [Rhododendron vialii]|uniref:F-box protein At4g18380-like n=1 Tax=Rhododendron vialii TaxID=182163 RepID=UPI0026604ABC|nr:F-box protein At4g18380-like [Rhododendron vialii]